MENGKQEQKQAQWSISDASGLYGVDDWGESFFSINAAGEVQAHLEEESGVIIKQSLATIIEGARSRGINLPLLLRFSAFLQSRLREVNEGFAKAMQEINYQGEFRGVYPVKVNQQKEVIEKIAHYGKKYRTGFEVGSKAELMIALAYLGEHSYLVCNGYKDEEYIDLALMAEQMGTRVFLVLEMPGELDTILARAEFWGVQPRLGVRLRLSTAGSGHWQDSAGEGSVFGLEAMQIIELIDVLKIKEKLHLLELLHYHQGSQIGDIHSVREAAKEAMMYFAELVREGANLQVIDVGGGLAVDYDGSKTVSSASCNYSVAEYCADIVEMISYVCAEKKIPHPTIICESGRAMVAYSSVLVFDILDVNSYLLDEKIPALPADAPDLLKKLADLPAILNGDNLQEYLNDAVYYREQIRSMFAFGTVSLRHRALADKIFRSLISRAKDIVESEPEGYFSDELVAMTERKRDFYYGNFSLFQSLPDAWAIKQAFPLMPLTRLGEKPTRRAMIADITCDCDGKIEQIARANYAESENTVPLHQLRSGEIYPVGIFLVGAYQETLGDLHNLLGDTNVIGVEVQEGKVIFVDEVEGDSVADVLSYVEYEPKDMEKRFRRKAETAVAHGKITPEQRHSFTRAYSASMDGYTYFEN